MKNLLIVLVSLSLMSCGSLKKLKHSDKTESETHVNSLVVDTTKQLTTTIEQRKDTSTIGVVEVITIETTYSDPVKDSAGVINSAPKYKKETRRRTEIAANGSKTTVSTTTLTEVGKTALKDSISHIKKDIKTVDIEKKGINFKFISILLSIGLLLGMLIYLFISFRRKTF